MQLFLSTYHGYTHWDIKRMSFREYMRLMPDWSSLFPVEDELTKARKLREKMLRQREALERVRRERQAKGH